MSGGIPGPFKAGGNDRDAGGRFDGVLGVGGID